MKTSIVLRRAKDHLRDGGHMMTSERYVCYAIDWCYFIGKNIGDRDRTRVKKLMWAHLGGAPSLEVWLQIHHRKEITNTPRYKLKIMATRKAWLDHLIEYYEAKGD